jgi:tripartite ATP-independent transporter DctM subunit
VEWYWILTIIIVLLLAFFVSGMYVAIAFLAVDIIGLIWFVGGEKGLHLLTTSMYDSVANYNMTPLPLYLLMAEILFESGVVGICLDAIDNLIGKVKARLNIVVIVAGAVFGAISGVGMGTTAMLGRTLAPEMQKRGYDLRLGIGCIMGAGVLTALIPPSSLAVLVGSLAGVSVAKMLVGGLIPGIVLTIIYIAYVIIAVQIKPTLAPPPVTKNISLSKRAISFGYLIPLVVIVFLVLGTMQLGIATPTEAAALGVLGSIIIIPIYKLNPFTSFKKAIMPTFETTVMLLIIFAGSKAFSQILSITGSTSGLAHLATGADVSPIVLFFLMQLVVFFLGMFIDQSSIMMICIPIFIPVVNALQFDPLLFWLVFLVNIITGAITPPFGMLLFTAKSVIPQASMRDIYMAGIPFAIISVIFMVIMVAYPPMSTWLPNVMRGG